MNIKTSLKSWVGEKHLSCRGLKGFLTILLAYTVLRLFSFYRICQVLKWAKGFCRREAKTEEVVDIFTAISQFESIRLGRVKCLETSLAVTLFALTEGLSVTWCVGVRTMPLFEAHAWVEVDGQAFDDKLSVDNTFKRLVAS